MISRFPFSPPCSTPLSLITMAGKSFHQPAHSVQSSFGETGQQFFKSTYFDKSKIGNSIIDFDIECINKALQAEGKVGVSSEKIASRVWEHYVDSARVVKRCFGNKIKDDWNLYNWGLALTQEFGLEQDRIELLVLIYGKTIPNRLNLAEFELLVLKHTSYKAMEKQERKYKWLDLMASFRIQSIKLRPSDECWTIGKRQLRTVLEVNDLNIVFDVTTFTSDLKRCDRYTNKIHMLLLDDPLLSGKRLSLASGRGSTTSLEAMAHAEKRRLELFKKKIAAEEDEQELEGESGNMGNVDTTGNPESITPLINKNKAAEDTMRSAFRKQEIEKENRAAERAVKMAQKAESRASYLKEDEERRRRVAAYLAKMREEKRIANALGAEATEEERREVDDFDGDGGDDGDDDTSLQHGSLTATYSSEEHRLPVVAEEEEEPAQTLPPISTGTTPTHPLRVDTL